ncbi:MAG: hypothetical protein MJ204_08095 [Bacteroidales bacterium]|nr:hypothetical protein [Bacteroidales bacterium]MCQ2960490.1 hypothetical protein [Bacteroidales bacterium]
MNKQKTQTTKEPTVSYGLDTVQQLKAQITEAIGTTENISVLQNCLSYIKKQICTKKTYSSRLQELNNLTQNLAVKLDNDERSLYILNK